MLSTLKKIRHNSFLRKYNTFWLFFGNIYRLIFSFTGLYFKIKISKFGKFYLHNKFFFSNFENWNSKHNSQFNVAIDLCENKKTIIDVGAHIGLFSLCAAKNSHQKSKIYAFEPAKQNYKFLDNHIKQNNFENKISAYKLLLGNDTKINKLYTEKDVSGKNSILNYNKHFKFFEEVQQTTLDIFCKNNNISPEIIKLDAEGAEIDILKGSVDVLRLNHPIIFLSVHPKILIQKNQTTDELYNLLKNFNYKIFDSNNVETNKFYLDEYICK